MKITKRIILIILSALLIFSAAACGKVEEKPKGEENTLPAGDVEQNPPAQEDPPSEDEEPDPNAPTEGWIPLSDETIKEIQQALYELHGFTTPESAFSSPRFYYGTYNGYVILFSEGQIDILHSVTVGTERFDHGSNFTIFAYKDGILHSMKDIYDNGGLTDEQISKIAQHHRSLYDTSIWS